VGNVGYEIELNRKQKRVGVIVRASSTMLPLLANKIIFYVRIAHWNAVLHMIQHTWIDCEVWQDARVRGAQALVKYFFDTKQLVIVSASEIERAKAVPDGERRQFIMPLDRCVVLSQQKELHFSEPESWLKFGNAELMRSQG
jgi:hypothetical protein